MPREAKAQFGMIGMAVMGRNLALNILDHDYSVAGYNLGPELMQQAVEESGVGSIPRQPSLSSCSLSSGRGGS